MVRWTPLVTRLVRRSCGLEQPHSGITPQAVDDRLPPASSFCQPLVTGRHSSWGTASSCPFNTGEMGKGVVVAGGGGGGVSSPLPPAGGGWDWEGGSHDTAVVV